MSLFSDISGASDLQDTCSVVPLSSCPEHLKTIALWFHQERQLAGFSGSLSDAENRLRDQNPVEDIPFTAVALLDGLVVGAASLVYYQVTGAAEEGEPWLSNVYVIEASRNQGLGSQLVTYMEDFARHRAFTKLKLFTVDKRDFYQRRGWVFEHKARVGRRDVDIMSLNLDGVL